MTEKPNATPQSDVPPTPEPTVPQKVAKSYEQRYAEAPELLKRPDLLYRVKKDYLDRDIIGEDTNKLLLFTILATSFTDMPLGAIVTGESSTGKSYLVNMVSKHFPNVIEYTRVTAASPDRSGMDFNGKILYIGELYGAEQAQGSLRVLISEGALKLWTTTRDEEGHITTECIETKGVPTFITTTTTARPEEELLNRLFIISTDESDEQTRRILEYEAHRMMSFDKAKELHAPPPLGDVLNYSTFDGSHYRIPFADSLAKMFPITSLKARRDFKKLLALVGSIARLHVYQRPIYHLKGESMGERYVMALPIDLYLALRVADKSLKQTLLSLQDRMVRCLSLFKRSDMILTAGMAAEDLNMSESRTRQILNALVNAGYLIKDESSRTHKFSLKHMEPPELIATTDLATLLKGFTQTQLESYVEANNLISLQGTPPFPINAVDPLTGDTKDYEGMLADLLSSGKRRSDIRGEATGQEAKRKPEKLGAFNADSPVAMSPPEKEEKSYTTLEPETLVELRAKLPSAEKPFTRDALVETLRVMGWNPYASGLIVENLEAEGVIYATDIDKNEYRWTRTK